MYESRQLILLPSVVTFAQGSNRKVPLIQANAHTVPSTVDVKKPTAPISLKLSKSARKRKYPFQSRMKIQ